jgi:hypothetical protein
MDAGSNIQIPVSRLPRAKLTFVAGVVALCATVGLVFFFFDPTRVGIFPVCVFHQLTGLDCPGCGSQRALHALLRGNFITALHLNAMFVLSLPLFAWLGGRYVLQKLRGEPVDFRFKWLWLYVAAWVVFGILRNLPLPAFAWFAA